MAAQREKKNLVDYVNRSLNQEEDFHFMRFEFLQRVNIVRMELDLIQLKGRIQDPNRLSCDDDLDMLKTTLEDYATAIQNYNFLHSRKEMEKTAAQERRWLMQRYFHSGLTNNTPSFHSHYSYFSEADAEIDPLRRSLMRYLPSSLAYSSEEYHARQREYSEGRPPKIVSTFVDRLARFLVALTGGVFLIVPTIIMTLRPSQTKSLVVVSITVLFFTFVLSFAVRVSNVETLVAAATYAAVMVVFLGATNGNTTT
ncbi:uncharacterized protein BJX67DRAFT_224098 [Aspergillus lucknowensis]|uniref:DUF6594 domain-containing protein n=1 Tax=Aspergillus lucknowensis TaxID=176173 RepID=A0ABR4LIK1_9EURO